MLYREYSQMLKGVVRHVPHILLKKLILCQTCHWQMKVVEPVVHTLQLRLVAILIREEKPLQVG